MDDTPPRTVWSSDGPAPEPKRPAPPGPPKKGPAAPVRVRIERQGRGGKTVTVVEGLPGHPARIEEIARALKARCGAGGTVKGRLVEVQGDHRDRVVEALRELGLDAKSAGG